MLGEQVCHGHWTQLRLERGGSGMCEIALAVSGTGFAAPTRARNNTS